MRVVFLSFILLSSSLWASAQLPEWDRVYTFDDSAIELNTSLVTFISKDISRVRFRWTSDRLESLNGIPKVKYKSRLEVVELNCSEKQYRPYHLTYLDPAGNIIQIKDVPGEWRHVTSSSMMEKLSDPACALIKRKTTPAIVSAETIRLQKASRYAHSFAQHLQRAKDLTPVINQFFVGDFLNRYLHDPKTNWFFNLDRDTAAKVKVAELQRFYVALMNAGYLSSMYLIGQHSSDADEPLTAQSLLPTDVLRLLKSHPYSTAYKSSDGNYDFLAEKINSVGRLRSYTDLLERFAALMRTHVVRERAEQSRAYQDVFEDWDLYWPRVRTCKHDCLGLPTGTELFEVNVPVFRLQVAEINGRLKVISAKSLFD